VAALAGLLDDIVEQVSPVGSLLDMLQGLKLADRLGLSWYDDAIGWITQSSYFDDLAGQFIGTGHAWSKHAHTYPPGMIDTQDDFIDLIETTIRNPDDVRQLERSRRAYWDSETGTVIIFDPGHPDLGTAFPPDDGYIYFRDVLK